MSPDPRIPSPRGAATRRHVTARRRATAVALFATSAAVGALATSAYARPGDPATGPASSTSASLHGPHASAAFGEAEAGSCPAAPNGERYGWHFVLPGNVSTFVSIEATFEQAGTVTSFVSYPTGKHAYVFTAGPDTLLSATAQVAGSQTRFVLSHVCDGTGSEEPTTTTTTVVEPTTTTVPGPEIS